MKLGKHGYTIWNRSMAGGLNRQPDAVCHLWSASVYIHIWKLIFSTPLCSWKKNIHIWRFIYKSEFLPSLSFVILSSQYFSNIATALFTSYIPVIHTSIGEMLVIVTDWFRLWAAAATKSKGRILIQRDKKKLKIYIWCFEKYEYSMYFSELFNLWKHLTIILP